MPNIVLGLEFNKSEKAKGTRKVVIVFVREIMKSFFQNTILPFYNLK